MNIIATNLPEVLIIEPKVYGDQRGFFLESFNERAFGEAVGYTPHFVQDNHSRSSEAVLRGLHLQRQPHSQGKLVRVSAGCVFDVAVDVRRGSPTFGKWAGTELSADNFRQLWIPPGFAHGFLVVSGSADFLYKTTDYYVPASEVTIRWDDPDIGIAWPLNAGQSPTLSARDSAAPLLRDAQATLPQY